MVLKVYAHLALGRGVEWWNMVSDFLLELMRLLILDVILLLFKVNP